MSAPRPDNTRPARDTVLRVSSLNPRRPVPFEIVPEPEARAALAEALDLPAIKKLRFAGQLTAEGRGAWRLQGDLGATVVQTCGVTLDPVSTRIDSLVTRFFVPKSDLPPEKAGESEMPEDDSVEPLGSEIDLSAIMAEALTLALPPFPRAPDADLASAQAAPPGAAPLDDARPKPFAALAGLKEKLEKGED